MPRRARRLTRPLRFAGTPTSGMPARGDWVGLLAEVLEGLPDAMTLSTALRDAQGRAIDARVDYMNARARAGQPDAAAAVGRLWSDLWPDLVANGSHAACMRVADTGAPETGEFVWTEHETSTPAGYAWRAVRIGADTLVWVLQDTTARLELEAEREARRLELASDRDAAVEASRLKTEFLATMSHELRTPLTGVVGNIGLLLRTPLTAAQRDYAETAVASSEALLGVIDDILDFARIGAGRLELRKEPIDVRALLEDVGDLLGVDAASGGLDLALLAGPDGPLLARGDGPRVRQVLINLVGNALKFTAAGEVVVEAQLRPDGDRLELVCSVRDTGPGIPETEQARLFSPFVQLDGSPTRRVGGIGLGLAIATRLCARMGGELGVRSTVGRGSTFWFRVPLDRPAPGDIPAAPVAAPVPASILVVDHHAATRRSIEANARALGATVFATEHPDVAEAWLRARVPGDPPCTVALLDPALAIGPLLTTIASDSALGGPRVVLLRGRGWVAETSALPHDFVLHKPVRWARLARVLSDDLGRTREPEPLPDGPPARVLIVDDNVVNRRLVQAMLEASGHACAVAEDGQEAVERVAAEPFDLVLMDCYMPVMDGWAATRAIRAAEPAGRRMPIIALTAAESQAEIEAFSTAGMDAYVPKPFRPENLLDVVGQWLQVGSARA